MGNEKLTARISDALNRLGWYICVFTSRFLNMLILTKPWVWMLQKLQILSQAMLRKYITYAKMHSNPKLRESDLEKVALVYADLRRESMVCPCLNEETIHVFN